MNNFSTSVLRFNRSAFLLAAAILWSGLALLAAGQDNFKSHDAHNHSHDSQAQLDDWERNKSWVDALLAEADPSQDVIEAGCYLFRRADLEEYSRNSWFILVNKWTNGVVYYSFNPNGMTDFKKNQFRKAVKHWENAAALAFFERPYGNEGVVNYIEVNDHPSANNSFVGMTTGRQVLNMFNWEYEYIVAHEIGHALGLWHEHTRGDRDTYISINTANINPAYNVSNWNIQTGEHEGTTYDFESVMHYGPSSGASEPNLVIISPKPGYESFFNLGLVGQRTRLSTIDKQGMAIRYGALVPAGAPDLSFASGTYQVASLTLTLTLPFDHQTGFSTYYYTLDGSDPTENSLVFNPNGAILLSNSTTVKVVHYRKQKSPSPIITRTYTLAQATPLVATPQILPSQSSQSGPFNCSISSATDGAQIRYTTNGLTPTEGSTLYSGPFQITQSTTVKARGYKTGHTPSDIATQFYDVAALQLPPPTIYPNGGSFNGSVTISFSTNILGATIRYTIDGSEPTVSSNPVDENPLILTQSATVKAKTFRDGFTPSNTAQASFTIIGSANTPSITPNGGTFTAPRSVTLATTTLGAEIRYTLNGSEPQSYSTLYTGPFNLPLGSTTVKAKAFLQNAQPSGTASAAFTVYSNDAAKVAAPYYRPLSRDHVNSVEVSLFCDTQDAQIRYTVGDNVQPADPTAASTLYSGPFTLNIPPGAGDFWFIKARAFKGGLTDSDIIGKTYAVYSALGTISNPTFDPNGGTFHNAVTVTMSATTNPPTTGIQYFRTIDGSDPFVPDPPSGGSNSFSLSQPATVKALAYRNFFGESSIATSNQFNFVCADPTFAPEENYHIDEVQFSIATDTTTSRRRYTLDGSEPEDTGGNGFTYTTPVALGIGTHIVKAKVFRNNFEPSETVTQVYVVEPDPVLPEITQQPASQNVDQFIDVAFSIAATGVPDPNFQWQYNSVNISGETTTTLRIPNVQPDNEGEYRCIVSNTAGNTTSTAAVLTVNTVITPTPTPTPEATPTPDITPTPTPTPTATPGDCVRFEVQMDGAQVPTDSAGYGSAVIQVDTVANTLTYHIQYFNLSAPETVSHIHGFAPRGEDAGVLYPLPLGSPKIGVINYDEADEANILAGLTYINIHTQTFNGGEIRGQIDGPFEACLTPTPTPEPTSEPLDGWRISEPEPDMRDRRVSMRAPARPEALPTP